MGLWLRRRLSLELEDTKLPALPRWLILLLSWWDARGDVELIGDRTGLRLEGTEWICRANLMEACLSTWIESMGRGFEGHKAILLIQGCLEGAEVDIVEIMGDDVGGGGGGGEQVSIERGDMLVSMRMKRLIHRIFIFVLDPSVLSALTAA